MHGMKKNLDLIFYEMQIIDSTWMILKIFHYRQRILQGKFCPTVVPSDVPNDGIFYEKNKKISECVTFLPSELYYNQRVKF